jgi:hypothetical protein
MKNRAASVKDRLLNLARKEKRDFNGILLLYVQERLLARLAASNHLEHFVLKGGLLLYTHLGEKARPTQDVDVLGRGTSSDLEQVATALREIAAVSLEDGLIFDPTSVSVAPIRPEEEYGGTRVRLMAHLGTAKIPVQIDIGFGDALSPQPILLDYPALLEGQTEGQVVNFSVWAYALETVVAEKFQAMVDLGEANSRLKDFYDIYTLSGTQHFQADILERSLRATFARRTTDWSEAVRFFALNLSSLESFTLGWNRLRRVHTALNLPDHFEEAQGAVQKLLEPLVLGQAKGQNWNPEQGQWEDKTLHLEG